MKKLLLLLALLALPSVAKASPFYDNSFDGSSTTLKMMGRFAVRRSTTPSIADTLNIDGPRGLFTWAYGINASTGVFTGTGNATPSVATSSGVTVAAGGVTAPWFDGAVTPASIAAGLIDTTKLATDSVSAVKILGGAVTGAKLAASAVDSSKLAADAVIEAKISGGAVTGGKLAASAVDTTKLATDAVTTPKLLTAAVTNPKIADSAVDTAKVATDAITTVKISGGAVTSAKIAPNTIDTGKLNATGIPSGYTIVTDGSATPNWTSPPAASYNNFVSSFSYINPISGVNTTIAGAAVSSVTFVLAGTCNVHCELDGDLSTTGSQVLYGVGVTCDGTFPTDLGGHAFSPTAFAWRSQVTTAIDADIWVGPLKPFSLASGSHTCALYAATASGTWNFRNNTVQPMWGCWCAGQ